MYIVIGASFFKGKSQKKIKGNCIFFFSLSEEICLLFFSTYFHLRAVISSREHDRQVYHAVVRSKFLFRMF